MAKRRPVPKLTMDIFESMTAIQTPDYLPFGPITVAGIATEIEKWLDMPIPRVSRQLLDEIARELKKGKTERATADGILEFAERTRLKERTYKHKVPLSMTGAIINSVTYPLLLLARVGAIVLPFPINAILYALQVFTTALGYRAGGLWTAERITGPTGPLKET